MSSLQLAQARPMMMNHLTSYLWVATKPQLSITINSTPVSWVVQWVTITADLKWNSHITNTCKSAKQKLGLLYRNFQQADHHTCTRPWSSLGLITPAAFSTPRPSISQTSWSPSRGLQQNCARSDGQPPQLWIWTDLPSAPTLLGRKFCYTGA